MDCDVFIYCIDKNKTDMNKVIPFGFKIDEGKVCVYVIIIHMCLTTFLEPLILIKLAVLLRLYYFLFVNVVL